MKKKWIIIAAAVLAIAVLASVTIFVRTDRDSRKMQCELYFLNDAETTLVSERRAVKYKSSADILENIVLELVKGPKASGNKRIMSKNVTLNSLTMENGGNVCVDFSSSYLTGDSTRDALSTYAVVKTLSSVNNVYGVKVTVDGEELKNADGTAMEYLTSADINLPTDTYTSEMKNIALYFPEKETNKLRKEDRIVKIIDQQPVEQYIINELINGTQDGALNNALNKDTTLLSVDVYNDICFVNFKSDFTEKNSGNEDKEKTVIYSIVASLTELANVRRVQFLLDGKKADKFGSINIGNPFTRNASMFN